MKTEQKIVAPSRRSFIIKTGGATLSAAAVAMLAGGGTLISASAAYADAATDIGILNTALGAELQAIETRCQIPRHHLSGPS